MALPEGWSCRVSRLRLRCRGAFLQALLGEGGIEGT